MNIMITLRLHIILFFCCLCFVNGLQAQSSVPADRLLEDYELIELLETQDSKELQEIKNLYKNKPEKAIEELAAYFREAFAERYFFNWKNFDQRFKNYQQLYSSKKSTHYERAEYFQSRYPANTQWKRPFKNLLGDDVSAYRLRHLARQHKAVDLAFTSFYEKKNPEQIRYFADQVRSLNTAFSEDRYETHASGNGIYEVFRAGYRVLNWLLIHHAYLSTERYSAADQIEFIKTLLHHGAQLHEQTPGFRHGNHQTRGLSALALIAIMLPEFQGSEAWYQHAMDLLGEHMEKEINPDGFQFERSVHYHLSDIDNYFYVYQLASLNKRKVPAAWEDKLYQMFRCLLVIAQPDRHAPVLQDDTDSPWAEYNEIDDAMALGAILFDDPEIRYFASKNLDAFLYWFVRNDQLEQLQKGEKQKPKLGSAVLETTGYYMMRNGWDKNSLYMIVSAGLDAHKPDHQHGDMLGVSAYAYGNQVLPNYQVRYYLPDLEFFKNSLVKNVATVDGIPHGRDWKPNSGGSGFGKWLKLPQPEVLAWQSTDELDYFAGKHDGYEDQGVQYEREILFVKDDFWIVRDVFEAETPHNYEQIWQGHYDTEKEGIHLRATFTNGAGLDVMQLGTRADSVSFGSQRGKGRAVFHQTGKKKTVFTTLLYPFKDFEERIPETENIGNWKVQGWQILETKDQEVSIDEWQTDASVAFFKNGEWILLGATIFDHKGKEIKCKERTNIYLQKNKDKWKGTILGADSNVLLKNDLF